VTCRELTAFIADFVAGELPPDTRLEFERHLDVCPNCVTYLSGYQDTVKMGRYACGDDDAPVPDTVPEELIQAVLSARSKSSQA
jgi:anti-sigma factor RsiW